MHTKFLCISYFCSVRRYMGQEEVNVDSTTLLGYALDGFPIYGPYSGTLDACNGRVVNNNYQYHVKVRGNLSFACLV